ncbi:hypothetical protein EP1X_06390 [Thermococcus sp. EP1]|uniref:hypothetical protein n=1 Tax=Thermococcus sp. EP1 TaxID=1591054 RepID=UPI0006DA6687|nr:hypothetical protein [Thermococcus sp. EP1]KPU62982.1 hypothetical protein EP1X_06390 [Thermococcus sp. EP1]
MRKITLVPDSKLSFLKRKTKRLVQSFSQNITLEDNIILLSKEEKIKKGTLLCSSSIVIGKRVGGKHYDGILFLVSRKFKEEEKITTNELPLEPKEYRVEVDVSGAGRVELPGFSLDNGILILYIFPKYVFQFPQASLMLSTSQDLAQITFNPTQFGFKGRVSLNLEDAEEVEVILKGDNTRELLFWGDEEGEFNYEFIKEPILLISHESLITPKELANAFGKASLISGHGEFEVEAKLKYPLKKAIRENIKFSVSLG